jgi:8-oxo-dGTP diphosphatase
MERVLQVSPLHVAVGVIRGSDGRVLVARRRHDQHQGGHWEFPGGKVEHGESAADALSRELWEELGIEVVAAVPLMLLEHRYADLWVQLDVWCVDEFRGQPQPREGQPLEWRTLDALDATDFPVANRAIIDRLRAQARRPAE